MAAHKIKIDNGIYEGLKRAAEAAGYSSADEFITHILEKAASAGEESLTEEEVRERLKGLGYLA